jgi:hypothetical protein
MPKIWVPPAARTFPDEVERLIASADDPVRARQVAAELEDAGLPMTADEIVEPGTVLVAHPYDWGYVKTHDGRRILAAWVEDTVVEKLLADGGLDVAEYGVVEDWDGDGRLKANCPALWLRLADREVIVPLNHVAQPCPVNWRHACRRGFAIAVRNPDPLDSRVLAAMTGPLSPTGKQPPLRAGRNEPCPCGSGVKFKRCCGYVQQPIPAESA